MDKTKEKKHYLWIDYVRFVCLFLVVLFHSPFLETYIWDKSLWLFRMPCFFFISGLLFRFEKYPSFIGFVKHRAKQILVPYFCFFIIAYIPWLLGFSSFFISTEIHQSIPFYEPVLEILRGTPRIILRSMWFLTCLFALQCTFYLVFKNINNKILAVIILLFFPLLPTFFDIYYAPWRLDRVCLYIPFYGLACLFRERILNFFNRRNLYAFSVLFFGVHLVFLWLMSDDSGNISDIYIRIFSSLAIIISVSALIKIISGIIGRIKLIEYISLSAVVVLAWHSYIFRLIQYVIKYTINSGSDIIELNFGLNLFLSALVMLILYIPIVVINRFMPFLIGKGKYFE